MNDEQRQRIKKRMIQKGWETNALLQECLEAMGTQAEIVPFEAGERLVRELNQVLRELFKPENQYCPAVWEELGCAEEISSQWIGDEVYIVWDGAGLPVIQGSLHSLLCNLEDVTVVSFDTWVVSKDMRRLVEMRGDGRVRKYERE